MATFTMTLSEIMEDIHVDTIDDAVPHAEIFGLDSYPIFDSAYRTVLNKKIIGRFWDREIAHETVEKFRTRMKVRMGELMPYYNDLYRSTMLDFDPLSTINISTIISGDTESRSDSNMSTKGNEKSKLDTDSDSQGSSKADTAKEQKSRAVSSLMPQTQLSGNGDYADSANDQVGSSKDSVTSNTQGSSNESRVGQTDDSRDTQGSETNNATMNRTSKTLGYQALPSQLVAQYRETLINVDLQILGELEKLFMSITTSGDEYFHHANDHYFGYYIW